MSDESVKDSPEGKSEGGEARMEASTVKSKTDQDAREEAFSWPASLGQGASDEGSLTWAPGRTGGREEKATPKPVERRATFAQKARQVLQKNAMESFKKKLLDNTQLEMEEADLGTPLTEDERAFLMHPSLRMPARERPKEDRLLLWELCKHGAWYSRLEPATGVKAFSLMEHRTFERGDEVFREGNVADGIYILIQGKCRIVNASEEGGENPELSLKKGSPLSKSFGMLNLKSSGAFAPIVNRQDLIQTFGDSFGDWGLLSGFRVQTIVCDSDVEVLYLPKESYMSHIMKKSDAILQENIQFIRGCPLFSRFGKAMVDRTANIIKKTRFAKGHTIGAIGHEPSFICIISSGTVRVARKIKAHPGGGFLRKPPHTLIAKEGVPITEDDDSTGGAAALFAPTNDSSLSFVDSRACIFLYEIVHNETLASDYVCHTDVEAYCLHRDAVKYAVSHRALDPQDPSIVFGSEFRQVREKAVAQTRQKLVQNWGARSPLIADGSPPVPKTSDPPFSFISKALWGCDSGGFNAPLTHEQIEKFPNLKFKPTKRFRNLVCEVSYANDAQKAGESTIEDAPRLAPEALDATWGMGVGQGIDERAGPPQQKQRVLRRIPGTDVPVLSAPVSMPRLDLEAIKNGGSIVRGAVTDRERQLALSLADVFLKRYPGTARTATGGSRSRSGGRGSRTERSARSARQPTEGGERKEGRGSAVWPAGSSSLVAPETVGRADIMVLESAGKQGYAEPGEFSGGRQSREGSGETVPLSLRENENAGKSSSSRQGVEQHDMTFSASAGEEAAHFLESMMEGRNMSSKDTVRYLFRGLSLTDVEFKEDDVLVGSNKPARMILYFPSKHHAIAAGRRATSLGLVSFLGKAYGSKGRGSDPAVLVVTWHKASKQRSPRSRTQPSTARVRTEAGSGEWTMPSRTAASAATVDTAAVAARGHKTFRPTKPRLGGRTERRGKAEADSGEGKRLADIWSSVLPHIALTCHRVTA